MPMASSKLSLYQRKRDFTKTAEPSGKTKIAPAEHPRFVVQKHAATRLHYDLRLEVDGVFKSWAVTKGPSLDPQDRRLPPRRRTIRSTTAISKEPYPRASMAAELSCFGTAASGQRTAMPPKRFAGELRFTLAGERLQGSWVLVRLRTTTPANASAPKKQPPRRTPKPAGSMPPFMPPQLRKSQPPAIGTGLGARDPQGHCDPPL